MVVGNLNLQWCFGKQHGIYPENWKGTSVWYKDSIRGYLSKENENTNSKGYTHCKVHSRIIHSRQDTEAN